MVLAHFNIQGLLSLGVVYLAEDLASLLCFPFGLVVAIGLCICVIVAG